MQLIAIKYFNRLTLIFIIGNQLTTQNMDKYCPETLTGTAFSIKNMLKFLTWQTQAQQATTAVSVSVC